MDGDWSFAPFVAHLKDKAWSQLGTSGSGNHFVEFGLLTVENEAAGLPVGVYLALLIAQRQPRHGQRDCHALQQDRHGSAPRPPARALPSRLAGLRHASRPGILAGDDADGRIRRRQSCLDSPLISPGTWAHRCCWTSRTTTISPGAKQHDGEEVIVHRKGATPAAAGVLGIIPGSMATPGYVVRGKGDPASLNSASHGAGRAMSRKKASETYTWSAARPVLERAGVKLLSAGVDEVPMVYKDIASVMRAQAELVEPLARFDPKLVKMAPAGERPED